MAKFVPFILKTDDDQKIGVKITRMKKADAAQTEKELYGKQTGCLPISKRMLLKSMH